MSFFCYGNAAAGKIFKKTTLSKSLRILICVTSVQKGSQTLDGFPAYSREDKHVVSEEVTKGCPQIFSRLENIKNGGVFPQKEFMELGPVTTFRTERVAKVITVC